MLYVLAILLTSPRLFEMTSSSDSIIKNLGEDIGNRTLYSFMTCEQLRAFSPSPDVSGYVDDCRAQSFTILHFSDRDLMSDI